MIDDGFYLIFGAIVGVLYPPRTKGWAKLQKLAIVMGFLSLASWSMVATLTWTRAIATSFWTALAVALLSTIGFLILGNSCRHYHEGRRGD